MSKVLIAVITCEQFKARADAQRATWVPGIQGADVRFFLARQDRPSLPDEVFLDVPDDYNSLPLKIKTMFQWALAYGYTLTFKTDDDTYIHPTRLMAAVPDKDYVGFLNNMPPRPWCSGFGYWMSERAMRIVSEASIPPEEWAEDRWVGGVLHGHRIFPHYDTRYAYYKPPSWKIHDPETVIAICDCSANPMTVQEWHNRYFTA